MEDLHFAIRIPAFCAQVDSVSAGSAEHSESLWSSTVFLEQNKALKGKWLAGPYSQPFFSFKGLLP